MTKKRKKEGGYPKEMELRRRAVQATADQFNGIPFKWGSFDCGIMVLSHMRRIGNPLPVDGLGEWKSAIGAKRAVKRLGFDTMDAFLDANLKRIPPAAARLGDVLSFEAEASVGGLGINIGNGAVLCYHEDAPEGPIAGRVITARGAWRVI